MPDAIPPGLMSMMQGGGQTPGGEPPPQGPVSAPMSTPQPPEGEKQKAMSQVQMGIKLFDQALMTFGSQTDEGKTLLDVLKKLSSMFGDRKEKSEGLIPSEIMNLVSSLPQGAGGMQPQGAPPQGAGAPPMSPPPMMQ
jgi:hypothetical protein